jgi:hypothetical protein
MKATLMRQNRRHDGGGFGRDGQTTDQNNNECLGSTIVRSEEKFSLSLSFQML